MVSPQAQRRSRRAVIVGVVIFVGIAAAFYLAATVHNGLPGATRTTVKAEFGDVHSLKPGDEVRQNSVDVGQVGAIQYRNGRALVTLELNGNRPVYRNAHAAVWDYTPLATKFIEINPGTPIHGPLGDATIPGRKNGDSADLYKVLNTLDPSTRAAATSSIRELGGGLAGHSSDLRDFVHTAPRDLRDLGTVSQSLADPRADLPGVLRSSNQLAARFSGRDQQIADLVSQSDTTLRAITVDEGKPLDASLKRLPDTLSKARTALDALDRPLANTQTALATLQPGANALGRAEPDVRGVLREARPPLQRVPSVAEQASPAIEKLIPTITDARPLAPHLTQALNDLAPPLDVLAPYANEAGQLWARGRSFVAEGPAVPGLHYARLGLTVGTPTATGGVLPEQLTQHRDPYPAPGQASHDQSKLPLGGDR